MGSRETANISEHGKKKKKEGKPSTGNLGNEQRRLFKNVSRTLNCNKCMLQLHCSIIGLGNNFKRYSTDLVLHFPKVGVLASDR